MRILLTGANGFVGRYLTGGLEQRMPEATLVGLGGGAPSGGGDCESVDLRDGEAVARTVDGVAPDLVIHLAAQSSVARGLDAADLTWSVNLSGSLSLALAIARHAPKATLLFASTAEVYGASFLGSPVSETTPTQPMNAYARSKRLAERMFADVLPPTCRLIVARPFNHTGPGQRDDFVLPSFARQIARIEAGLQPPRLAVGNLDVRRDFLDVRDVVEAYGALIEAAADLPRRLMVNIASGHPQALRAILETMRGMARVPFEVTVDPARLRPVDLPVAYAEPALLRRLTGWRPRYDFATTLGDLLDAARAA